MSNRERKKKIFILFAMILIAVIYFVKSCTNVNGAFYEELYAFLDNNSYNDLEINNDFLENNDLYDNDFVCKYISYENGTLEFINCVVAGEEKEFCTYDGEVFDCSNEADVSLFSVSFSDGDIDREIYQNKDVGIAVSINDRSGDTLVDTMYCVTDGDACVPDLTLDDNFVSLGIESATSKVCVMNQYEDNLVSEIVCSENYKIDKTKPVISYDVIGKIGNNGWYRSDVDINYDATDELSGIAELSSNISSITYNTIGEKIIICATDLAGNISLKEFTLKVDKDIDMPSEIVIDGTGGSNGWYLSDVVLSKTNASDSFSGIESVVLSDKKIDYNTTGKKVSVVTTDTAGNVVKDEMLIKIDKDYPIVGNIVIDGVPGTNGWYKSDVKIDKTNGSDNTSGHASTVVDILKIDDNTDGTIVTITTTDMAGRSVSKSETVKIDKAIPTIIEKEKLEFEVGTNVDVVNNFIVEFGISGGNYYCDIGDTTTLDVGVHNFSCTATSNAGLSYTLNTSLTVKNLEYKILEYIESDGTQYIDTGVMNTGDYIIEDNFLITDSSKNTGSWLFSGRTVFDYSLGVHISSTQVFNGYGGPSQTYTKYISDNMWYHLYFSRTKMTIWNDSTTKDYPVNGSLIPESYQATILLGGNLAGYRPGTIDNRNFVGKRKYFKITDATTGLLVRDFVPVQLTTTGEYGFWDLVEDKFYANQGTGEFISPN